MTRTDGEAGERELAALFAAARLADRDPGAELMARVFADAEAAQVARRSRQGPGAVQGGWRGLWRSIGGWPGLGGIATAALVGVWIGESPPASLSDLAGSYLGIAASTLDASDLTPGFQDMLTEG